LSEEEKFDELREKVYRLQFYKKFFVRFIGMVLGELTEESESYVTLDGGTFKANFWVDEIGIHFKNLTDVDIAVWDALPEKYLKDKVASEGLTMRGKVSDGFYLEYQKDICPDMVSLCRSLYTELKELSRELARDIVEEKLLPRLIARKMKKK